MFNCSNLILPLVGTCLMIALSNGAHAQQAPTPPPALRISAENPSAFDPATATQAWLDTVPSDQRAKSDAYFEGGYGLILWNFLSAAAISIFLLSSRISARLRDFAERRSRFKAIQVSLFAIPYFVLVYVLSFPLNLYENFYREHQYGFATQTFAPWFREQLIALGVALLIGTILLIVLYAVFRCAPRTWWIWGTVVMVVFLCAVACLSPVYIQPLIKTDKTVKDPQKTVPIMARARAH
jgi:STE24 endopeptidase